MFIDFISTYILPYLISSDVLSLSVPVPFAEGATVSASTLISLGLVALIFVFIVIPLVDLLSWLICLPVRFLSTWRRRRS